MQPVQKRRESWRYVPRADRQLPPEEQTTFTLTPLIQGERLRVWDDASWIRQERNGEQILQPRSYQAALELCVEHIADVENFPAKVKDPTSGTYGYAPNAPKPFPVAGTREQKLLYLDEFDDLIILEVGNEIRDKSTLDSDAKN